nr:Wzz/FepE/Etk N-terminal domain-containing protein [uncultured Carboxylicivirga sp.]
MEMDIYRFIQVLIRQSKWLFILPIITGSIMYFLTRNPTFEYSTNASIFTAIASGSSLEDLGNSRVDYFATKTAYNNLLSILNSRSVIEETALRLLALHLITEEPIPSIISKESFTKFQETVPGDVKELVVKDNEEKTYLRLLDYMKQDKSNFLYSLINFDHPHYSFKAISSIKTVQDGGSDVIVLSYKSNDPGITFQTLRILIEVFLDKYSLLKRNQTDEIIQYFTRQLNNAAADLNSAEDRLLQFNSSNNIVNYYEQTKHISSQQEKIEVKLQDVLLEYKASEAILSKLEAETQSRFNINLKTKEIMQLRNHLISVNRMLAEMELSDLHTNVQQQKQQQLNDKKKDLETSLNAKMDSLYIYEKHSDGIAIEKLLNDWLQNVIDYESAKARLLAMEVKSAEFKELYNQYAPLGATLKRIEREIDVKEKSYLEILHHLGLAKLKQQNDEMRSNMKLLDKPHLPIDAEPTQRKIFVLVIMVATFMFTFLGIFLFELLDKTIKTGKRFASMASIHIAGTLPNTTTETILAKDDIIARGLKPAVEMILYKYNKRDNNESFEIQFLSNWSGEGKTYCINQINKLLMDKGYDIVSGSKNELSNTNEKAKIITTEIKSLSDNIIDPVELKKGKLHFLIADANRTWSSSDTFILNHLKETVQIEPLGLLNNLRPENMEEMIGQIPKKRSKFRRLIKEQVFKRLIS